MKLGLTRRLKTSFGNLFPSLVFSRTELFVADLVTVDVQVFWKGVEMLCRKAEPIMPSCVQPFNAVMPFVGSL